MIVCKVDSLVWIPIKAIPSKIRKRVAHDLCITSRYGDNADSKPMKFWRKQEELVGVPVAYGVKLAEELGFSLEDNRSLGKRVVYRNSPEARSAKQQEFFSTLTQQTRSQLNVFAVAPTGSGKTIAALKVVHSLGRTALVIVPSISLAYQWRDRIAEFLSLPVSSIGILKGGKCPQWEQKSVVVAVVHSLCKGRMGQDFHKHFGIAIWDEAHRMAAKWFSKSLLQVVAKYRVALTATPNRKDGMTKILHLAFNEPNNNVTGNELRALPCIAYVVHTNCTAKSPSWGNTTMKLGKLMSSVAADSNRNALIARLVRTGYEKGKNILVLSDRIEQLRYLIKFLADDIPKEDMGLFISATSEKQQEHIKQNCRVIFATYGMMKEGQDVPRLDMGIDATPRSEGNQAVGRVRREFAGKESSMWITLFDAKASQLLQGISSSRIKDYKACGVDVVPVAYNLSEIEW